MTTYLSRSATNLTGCFCSKEETASLAEEPYLEKVRAYANTFCWNTAIHADTYKTNGDLEALKQRHELELQPYDLFRPDQLEARQVPLFRISSVLWEKKLPVKGKSRNYSIVGDEEAKKVTLMPL